MLELSKTHLKIAGVYMWGAYPLAFISYLIKYTSHNKVKLLDCHLSCFIETFLKIILYLFASLDLMLERLHEEEHDAKIQMSKKMKYKCLIIRQSCFLHILEPNLKDKEV